MRCNKLSIGIFILFLTIIFSFVVYGFSHLGATQSECTQGSQRDCQIEDCLGYQFCNNSIWSECVDDPRDDCPATEEESICGFGFTSGSTRTCTTNDGCDGMEFCDEVSGWLECVDIPNDNCPATVEEPICGAGTSIGSTRHCTSEGCDGFQICKEDGSGWLECVDVPDDDCPASVTKVCISGSTRFCTTIENCKGIETCKFDDSGWRDCKDIPDDNCPAIVKEPICGAGTSIGSTRPCTTLQDCPGRQTCFSDGAGWEDCHDVPNDNCPFIQTQSCKPDSVRFCPTSEGCPSKQICKEDGTSWRSCEDIPDDDCPASATQICIPNEIEIHPCTNQKGRNGILQVECRSDGSGWYPVSNCYVPTQEEIEIIIEQEDQIMFEEVFSLDEAFEVVEEEVFEVEFNEEEEDLLHELIVEANEQREEALEREEEFKEFIEERKDEFRKLEQESIKEEVKLKLLEKIKEISDEEFEEKMHLIKKIKKEFIKKAQKEPEFIVDTELKEMEKESALRDLNKILLIKDNTDKALDALKEETITIERIEEEIESIEERIEEIDIEKNFEETKKAYEETIENTKIEKVANIFEDIDIVTGQVENITIVSLFIKPEKTLHNLSIYETIPKELASSADEIIFYGDNFEIIESDPLIVWTFATVDSDIVLSYGIKKKFDIELLKETETIPIAKVVGERGLGTLREEVPLFKFIFPAFLTALIVFMVIFFHRPSTKKD